MDKTDGILGGLDWLTKQEPTVLFALVFAGVTIVILLRANKFAKSWLERICWVVIILSSYILFVGFVHGWYVKHRIKDHLSILTRQECSILKGYLKKDTLSAHPNKGTGPYLSLMKDGILYYAGERNEYIDVVNLHRWIFVYLKEHPELLKPNT